MPVLRRVNEDHALQSWFAEYQRLEYDHLVIIADKLNRDNAKKLKEHLGVLTNRVGSRRKIAERAFAVGRHQ
jgi:hypothetical protein